MDKKGKKNKGSWIYRFVLFMAKVFFKIFYRHKVYGLEHYYPGAAIIAANHVSFLDPPAVAISWPEEVHFLARGSLFKNKIFGSFIRLLNSHPVRGDAADKAVFKTIFDLLKKNKKIILFPEGQRSSEDVMGAIKPGIGLLLSHSRAAIIPTYINGTYEVWSRHRKLPRWSGRTACVFGSPLLWESFAHLEKKEAHKEIIKKVSESILELKNWYKKGALGTPP